MGIRITRVSRGRGAPSKKEYAAGNSGSNAFLEKTGSNCAAGNDRLARRQNDQISNSLSYRLKLAP